MKIKWFWLAFILVLIIGSITAVILKNDGIFADTVFLLVLMGLGKFWLATK